jgi:hypothetical protein
MFRALLPSSLVIRLTAAAAILTLASNAAQAQVKPFKITGKGYGSKGLSIFGADSPYEASGVATHLGKYSGDQGVANVVSFNPFTGAGTFKGSFVFVAANGDKFACTHGDPDNGAEQVGEFQVYDAGDGNVQVVFIAEFNPILDQCTGRFKDIVDGSFLMVAVSEPFPLQIDANGFTPPFGFTWEGEGWIEFDEGN